MCNRPHLLRGQKSLWFQVMRALEDNLFSQLCWYFPYGDVINESPIASLAFGLVLPLSPNRRSKSTRGLFCVGRGVLALFQEIVLV